MPPYRNTTGDGVIGKPSRHVLAAGLATARDWIRRRVREARTAAELRALDDAQLRDIGVDRSEIASVARGLAQGDATRRKR